MPNSLSLPTRRLVRPGLARPSVAHPTEADIALARLSPVDATPDGIARRRFLQGSLAVGGASGLTVMPGLFDGIAAAATPLSPSAKILVTVFLSGGNDHLNTLVPADSGTYHSARGSLAVSTSSAMGVGEGLYLHPNLTRLKTRFDAGQVAFIRGVGESTDDHSHFTSAATWMSGIQNMIPPTGWLGRFQDGAGLDELGAVAIGWGGVPLLLRGGFSSAVALPNGGNLFGAEREEDWERLAFEMLADLGGPSAGLGLFGPFVADAMADAVDTAESLAPAFVETLPEENFPRDLALAAQVINLNLGTQLVNVSLSGFDTHDSQRPGHDDLMAALDAGIDAFFNNLAPSFAARTTMMIFSEFGRRVEQNSSGTDHGTAGMMMMVGPSVNGGLHGQQPSLTNLDQRGDMHHHVDFRSVYATVLEDWLDADAGEVLQANHSKLDLFSSGSLNLFWDVNPEFYYAPAIAWLATTGITNGTAPGQFAPEDPVTRGQMATFLWRYSNRPGGAPSAGFHDVPANYYYTEPINWLYQQGITTGTTSTTFAPEDPVTRGQMATFLWRLEGEQSGPLNPFNDVPRNSYFAPAVDWLADTGITSGTTSTTFSPEDVVTRGQMATFLWRLAGSPA